MRKLFAGLAGAAAALAVASSADAKRITVGQTGSVKAHIRSNTNCLTRAEYFSIDFNATGMKVCLTTKLRSGRLSYKHVLCQHVNGSNFSFVCHKPTILVKRSSRGELMVLATEVVSYRHPHGVHASVKWCVGMNTYWYPTRVMDYASVSHVLPCKP